MEDPKVTVDLWSYENKKCVLGARRVELGGKKVINTLLRTNEFNLFNTEEECKKACMQGKSSPK